MARDEFSKLRQKRRLVFEVRYDPILETFDQRGKILDTLFSKFKAKAPLWRVSNVEIQIMDDLTSPSRYFSVDHLTSRIVYEDPGSMQEFYDDTTRFIESLYDIFPKNLTELNRVGVRFVSIFQLTRLKSFQEVLEKIKTTFYNPNLPVSINLTDCKTTLRHDAGQIIIGPVRKDEDWINQTFKLLNQNIPQFGLGVDIDSFVTNVSCKDQNQILETFSSVYQLTTATEREIILPFER